MSAALLVALLGIGLLVVEVQLCRLFLSPTPLPAPEPVVSDTGGVYEPPPADWFTEPPEPVDEPVMGWDQALSDLADDLGGGL